MRTRSEKHPKPPQVRQTFYVRFPNWIFRTRNVSCCQRYMRQACGGIVIAPDGRVLLRKPVAQHKGRLWTFAKGKPLPGENPEQTACREVLEETGVVGQILKPIQLENVDPDRELYFLMAPISQTDHHDHETEAVVWATREGAEELLSMTIDEERRQRDLRLLQEAYLLFLSLKALT